MSVTNCLAYRPPDVTLRIQKCDVVDVYRERASDNADEWIITLTLRNGQVFHLPPNTPASEVQKIYCHKHRPIFVVWAEEDERYPGKRMVHSLLLSQRIYMVFTPMLWFDPEVDPEQDLTRRTPAVTNCIVQHGTHKDVTLHCGVVICDGMEDDDVLALDDQSQQEVVHNGVENLRANRLLVPHNIKFQQRMVLTQNLHQEPVPVIYDQQGRLYYAVVNGAAHVVSQPYWSQSALIERDLIIHGVTKAARPTMLDTLNAPYHVGDKLFLPKLTEQFEQWKPSAEQGRYQVRYDSSNRVFYIKNEEAGVDIDLSALWDTRYVQKRVEGPLPDRNAETDIDELEVVFSSSGLS
jgi:hypothetical protein